MQAQDSKALRLGFLVPSSNTVVEPVTYQLLQALPHPQPSAHFARLRVVRVHSDSGAQFDNERRIEAASSLADALCDAIAWNGTSASWLGLQQDRDLCSALTSSCMLPTTSSSLATIAALTALRARTYALVTPYTDDIQVPASSRSTPTARVTAAQASILTNYSACGFECVGEVHMRITVNTDIGRVPVAALVQHCDAVCKSASAAPDAIILLCTNLTLHGEASSVEQQTGATLIDSVYVTLWHTLQLLGVNTQPLQQRYGKVFSLQLRQQSDGSQ